MKAKAISAFFVALAAVGAFMFTTGRGDDARGAQAQRWFMCTDDPCNADARANCATLGAACNPMSTFGTCSIVNGETRWCSVRQHAIGNPANGFWVNTKPCLLNPPTPACNVDDEKC
jgi:hypothetical protein